MRTSAKTCVRASSGVAARRSLMLCAALALGAACTPAAIAQTPALVQDINVQASSSGSSNPGTPVVLGTRVIFAATGDGIGTELYVSDGTSANTKLLKDINPGSGSSTPINLTLCGGKVYFTADDGVHGRELWVTDGTAVNTIRLTDINAGSGSSNPSYLNDFDGRLFFVAGNGSVTAIYLSNGTAIGTVPFTPVVEGDGLPPLNPQYLKVTHPEGPGSGVMWFSASSAAGKGAELWLTDGQPATGGTFMVKDINSGPGSSNPQNFAGTDGGVWFTADDGVHGRELWFSDGSDSCEECDGSDGGTFMVKDINPGLPSSTPTSLVSYETGDLSSRRYAFFAAYEPTTGVELYEAYYGPPFAHGSAGTFLVADLNPGPASSSPHELVIDQDFGTVLFSATNPSGTVLYEWDGGEGTPMQVPFPGGDPPVLSPTGLTPLPGEGVVVFSATRSDVGSEFFYYTGGGSEISLLTDLNPGAASSTPGGFVFVNGLVVFAATEAVVGRELWSTTGGPPALIKDLKFANSGSAPTNLTASNGKLFFQASDGLSGAELWVSAGTDATTQLIDINPGSGSSSPQALCDLGGVLIFNADDGAHGAELWRSNGGGVGSGTTMVSDIRAGSLSSGPLGMTAVNGVVVFSANDGSSGVEPWMSDGLSVTQRLVNVNPVSGGAASSSPFNFAAVGSGALARVYFAATNGTGGIEPYTTDGTGASTLRLKDINPGAPSSTPGPFVDVNGTAFFPATTATNGRELWKSDGTSAGTLLQKDIYTGVGSSSPASLVAAGGVVYFAATTLASGVELWKSDPVSNVTQLVKDIRSGSASSTPQNFASFNNTVYFSADDGVNGRELWVSKGTGPSTTMLIDLNTTAPGASSSPQNLVFFGDTLYFSADDGVHGRELWKTDGTAIGTVMVTDLNPGAGSSNPRNLTIVPTSGDTLLYFTADDGVRGEELYVIGKVVICKPNLVTDSGCLGPTDLLSFISLYFANYDGLGSGVPGNDTTMPSLNPNSPVFAVPCTPVTGPPVISASGLKADYDGDCQLTPNDFLGFLQNYFNPLPQCFDGC